MPQAGAPEAVSRAVAVKGYLPQLMHVAARLIRSGRQRRIRISENWLWAAALQAAFLPAAHHAIKIAHTPRKLRLME
jgi:hypothetical protein